MTVSLGSAIFSYVSRRLDVNELMFCSLFATSCRHECFGIEIASLYSFLQRTFNKLHI